MRGRHAAQECRVRRVEGRDRALPAAAGSHRDVLPENRWPGRFRQGCVAAKRGEPKSMIRLLGRRRVGVSARVQLQGRSDFSSRPHCRRSERRVRRPKPAVHSLPPDGKVGAVC